MRPSAVVCSSLAISVASASRPGMALIPGPSSSGFSLLARQNPFCTSESTCAECFGDGYIICDDIGCFNPEEHDQCCAGAGKFAGDIVGKMGGYAHIIITNRVVLGSPLILQAVIDECFSEASPASASPTPWQRVAGLGTQS